jgi:hypothetical protein
MPRRHENALPPEAIRGTLVRRAGAAPDAAAVADATLGTLHQLAAQLSPVIGVRGVDALLTYSLHQTSQAFSWIEGDHKDTATLLASIKERLQARETAEALEASCALLLNLTDLLEVLIGESLTARLLSPVWANPLPASAPETRS